MCFNYFNSRETILGSSTPTNLDEAFRKFLSSLELTETQSSLVADRNNALRERLKLNAPYSLEKTILYGSYDRFSQIRPRPTDSWTLDVDVLAILEGTQKDLDNYFNNKDGGWRLLDATFNAINGFQGLPVAKDAPSVTVKWETQKMKVEITPAFHCKGGGFLIPSTSVWSTNWQVTDPVGDAKALTKANEACYGELKPLIKAWKCWNRKEGKILSSYAVETVGFHSAPPGYQGFYSELRRFFNKLLELDGNTLAPPSGIGGNVSINLGYNRYKVEEAYNGIGRALSYSDLGKHRDAILEMAKVFGAPFPLAESAGLLNPWRL